MEYKKPWEFVSDFSEDRLTILGQFFYHWYNSTAKTVKEEVSDDPFVIGTSCFGVVRSELLKLNQLEEYDWFRLVNTTFAIVMKIGNAECRFFTTKDIYSPKAKVFKLVEGEALFPMEEFPEMYQEPVLWRWLIQKPVDSEFGTYEVYFVGFDSEQNMVSQWHFGNEKVLDNFDNIVTIEEIVQDTDNEITKKSDDKQVNDE